jgi:hypothetical protein
MIAPSKLKNFDFSKFHLICHKPRVRSRTMQRLFENYRYQLSSLSLADIWIVDGMNDDGKGKSAANIKRLNEL